jgi:Uma2 family endonuclease
MKRDRAPRVETRRWTRREYARMIAAGILHEDEPVELIEGRLVVAEPQNTPHARAIELVAEALRAAFGPGWRIRVQLPVALEPDSEPEPDVSVVAGSPRDHADDHPSRPALVVEVADTSLRLDRVVKGRLYARGAIAEYWIVNLPARVVEIYRRPRRRSGGHAKYAAVTIARPGESVQPLASPRSVAILDLLP